MKKFRFSLLILHGFNFKNYEKVDVIFWAYILTKSSQSKIIKVNELNIKRKMCSWKNRIVIIFNTCSFSVVSRILLLKTPNQLKMFDIIYEYYRNRSILKEVKNFVIYNLIQTQTYQFSVKHLHYLILVFLSFKKGFMKILQKSKSDHLYLRIFLYY